MVSWQALKHKDFKAIRRLNLICNERIPSIGDPLVLFDALSLSLAADFGKEELSEIDSVFFCPSVELFEVAFVFVAFKVGLSILLLLIVSIIVVDLLSSCRPKVFLFTIVPSPPGARTRGILFKARFSANLCAWKFSSKFPLPEISGSKFSSSR